MQVGFTVVCRDRDVEFQILGRDAGDPRSLVSFHRFGNLAAILMGRLHYRKEVLAQVGPDLPQRLARECQADDAALAVAAYRLWGREGLTRLEGDFSVVVWDGGEQRLLASRDPLGGYPLFWTQTGTTLALGTSLQPLLTLRPARSLDLDYLADYVVLPFRSMRELPNERSAYEGVQRLVAGTVLSVRLPGGAVERHRYWDWLERQVDPGTDRLEEVEARYGALLRGAVRERLHGTATAHLSGGMDSTSVALIAAEQAAAEPGAAPLHTLSLVYDKLPSLARERPYLESALRRQHGVVAHQVAADDLLDFNCFQTAPAHDEPWPWLCSQTQEQALVERAANAGAASILTGHGADGMLELQPYYLTDLLRRGRLFAAWGEACRWAAAANCSPWKFLGPFGVANLLPAWARAGLGPLVRGGYAAWKTQSPWTIAPWIRPAFARRYGLRGRALANLRSTYSSCRPVGLSVALHGIGESANDFSRWYLAAPRGIHLAHPFLDPRVLCFGLGMQTRLRREPGRQKPVLAEAMRGVLPEEIRRRPGKGHFNEVYFRGLARNRSALEALIDQAHVDDLDMLDKTVLRECLHRAALGTADHMLGLSRLNSTLSLLKWLALENERPSIPPAPARVIRMTGLSDTSAFQRRAQPCPV
jgi:asparagine synthase (glutamine-hydrolysing)